MADTATVSFVDLMALETVGDDADKYMSKIPSFNPGMEYFLAIKSLAPLLKITFFTCSFLRLNEEADARLLGGGIAYGGHVYAQSVWAASQTVGNGMIVHVCSNLPPQEKLS